MKKKTAKAKVSKSGSKRSQGGGLELPSFVDAMTKLVQRLESLEGKVDAVISRVSNLAFEVRNAGHAPQRAEQKQSPGQPERRERVMYQAVCADCKKSCEVPFKPSESRAVYCKECWALRKSGHAPQDPDMRSKVSPERKAQYMPPAMDYTPEKSGAVAVLKGKKAAKATKKRK
ncbi:MAG TPA: CxxC-x17-CxxC domain-containing protein [Verrucomicrobiae bacterium]|nr:CxxC-x17-CxxC domain-containing protein [Verrucomicrobiae bacterium]